MKSLGFQSRSGECSILGRATILSAVSLVALLAWLSADPEAHEYFHHDADHADHHCTVSDFALGEGYYVAPQIVSAPTPLRLENVNCEAAEILREPVDFVLLPICGPPLSGLIA
jgi:hypothetical protein